MSSLSRRASVVVLMGMLILIVGSGQAKAQAIVVTDTVLMPTGDPQVIIDFQIALPPGTTLSNGDTFEVFSIPDLNLHLKPTYIYTSGNTDYSSYFDVSTSSNQDGTTDITLTYNHSSTPAFANLGDTSLSIGDLYALTTADFPPPNGSPLLDPIDYMSTVGGSQHTGMTTPTVAVPEPASLAMLGVGIGSLWFVARRRRRLASRD